MKYATAAAWREAAMQRESGVDADESELRRDMVRRHLLQEGVQADEETLADYELYIQGKMELEEYQQYLLFKHGS